ncbi:MAG: SET domain-containing protein-lysine N-methyltransferase [Anaerolineae bacterium]|nr:MAG: SET domain-containing protein-lysine N-methyltransferase [Anaerolineae bacterium]
MPTSYLSPKLEVRAAPHKGGFAVYARQALEKDELVCVWTGRAVTFAELQQLSDSEKSHTIQIEDEIYLAPLGLEEEPADFINHSCDPNAGIRGQVSLVAMRPIAAGEEITFDYAMADSTPYDEFTCACGSPRCRGRVSGDDWKRSDLWERYDGYFSAYLQRKIVRLQSLKSTA